MNIDAQIEAVLFFTSEPLKITKISEILGQEEPLVREALTELEKKLAGRGVVLIQKDDEISLGTSPEASTLIEKITKDELARDLGSAAIETLTIVLYKSPIPKNEIDFIRGVNSNTILRNLLIRGLVEKIPSTSDQRSFLYRPTTELLQFLGISKIEDLPEYDEFRDKVHESIATFEKNK